MKKTLLSLVVALTAICSAWAYDVPTGYTIKNVFIGNLNIDETVSVDDFEATETLPSSWNNGGYNTVGLGNVEEIALGEVGVSTNNVPTYVSGKTMQRYQRQGTTTGLIYASFNLDEAVSTGKLIFNGDIYGKAYTNDVFFRFCDEDNNPIITLKAPIGTNNLVNMQYSVGGGSFSDITGTSTYDTSAYTNWRTYSNFRLTDFVIDLESKTVSFVIDYIGRFKVGGTNVWARNKLNVANIDISAFENVKSFQIGRYCVSSTNIYTHMDNISFYHVDLGSDAPDVYDYTVNLVDKSDNILQTIASGSCFADYTVYAPHACYKDGMWYVKDNTSEYGTTINASQTYNVVYTANPNMVSFAEAESSTKGAAGNYSGGFIGCVAAQNYTNRGIGMGTLQPGVYRMTANVIANPTREVWLRDMSFATTNEADNMLCKISATGKRSVEFIIDKETTVGVNGKNAALKSNQSADFDYVYIEKIADLATTPVTVSAAGYATLFLDYAATIPAGVTAYTASIENDYATLTAIEGGVIPANTGVVLKAEAGDYSFVQTAAVAPIDNNALVGSAVAGTAVDGTVYALGNPGGIVGFYPYSGVTYTAKKAYLQVPNGSAAVYRFNFEEANNNETAISTIKAADENDVIYDLFGRKANGAKGLQVKNGKVIMVK